MHPIRNDPFPEFGKLIGNFINSTFVCFQTVRVPAIPEITSALSAPDFVFEGSFDE